MTDKETLLEVLQEFFVINKFNDGKHWKIGDHINIYPSTGTVFYNITKEKFNMYDMPIGELIEKLLGNKCEINKKVKITIKGDV